MTIAVDSIFTSDYQKRLYEAISTNPQKLKLTKLNLFELSGFEENNELLKALINLLLQKHMTDLQELTLENSRLSGHEVTSIAKAIKESNFVYQLKRLNFNENKNAFSTVESC